MVDALLSLLVLSLSGCCCTIRCATQFDEMSGVSRPRVSGRLLLVSYVANKESESLVFTYELISILYSGCYCEQLLE